MSVLQNQDQWWGEGDDMFFIDGESRPSINGTGSEDYFLGAWGFAGGSLPVHGLYGAPVKGEEQAGSRSFVYRFFTLTNRPFRSRSHCARPWNVALRIMIPGSGFFSVSYLV